MNEHRGDLNLITVFLEVFRQRSITRAAEALDLTQPAVSSALKRFRNQVGTDMFVRDGRGIAPTTTAEFMGVEVAPLPSPTPCAPRPSRRADPRQAVAIRPTPTAASTMPTTCQRVARSRSRSAKTRLCTPEGLRTAPSQTPSPAARDQLRGTAPAPPSEATSPSLTGVRTTRSRNPSSSRRSAPHEH